MEEALTKFQALIDENPRDFRPYLCQVNFDELPYITCYIILSHLGMNTPWSLIGISCL